MQPWSNCCTAWVWQNCFPILKHALVHCLASSTTYNVYSYASTVSKKIMYLWCLCCPHCRLIFNGLQLFIHATILSPTIRIKDNLQHRQKINLKIFFVLFLIYLLLNVIHIWLVLVVVRCVVLYFYCTISLLAMLRCYLVRWRRYHIILLTALKGGK